MARRPRFDAPDVWFHVMNRGIARRTLFERREDMAVFLGHLGEACARGEIEVHAFALMTTHYHLLVRSPFGRIRDAMQRVQTEYSRWFNRRRRRDGPLVRGRYAAKVVDSHTYRCTLVRYIDHNPVSAGLVVKPEDYPYGSARLYQRNPPGECPWLERSWVESEACEVLGLPTYDPASYSRAFGRLPEELARVVEARTRSRSTEDALDELVRAPPTAIVDWMKRKAELADGTRPALPVISRQALEEAVRCASGQADEWTIGRRQGWLVVEVGLARQLCGSSLEEAGERVGLARSATSDIARTHRRLLRSDAEYAARAGSVARRALDVWKAEGGGK